MAGQGGDAGAAKFALAHRQKNAVVLTAQADRAIHIIARAAPHKSRIKQAVINFVGGRTIIQRTLLRQAGRRRIRLDFVVVIVFVQRATEFRVIVKIKAETFVVA